MKSNLLTLLVFLLLSCQKHEEPIEEIYYDGEEQYSYTVTIEHGVKRLYLILENTESDSLAILISDNSSEARDSALGVKQEEILLFADAVYKHVNIDSICRPGISTEARYNVTFTVHSGMDHIARSYSDISNFKEISPQFDSLMEKLKHYKLIDECLKL